MANFLEKRKKIRKIAEKHKISLILVFGSKVSGQTHQESDLDIGVLSRKEPDYKNYSQLYSDLAKVFRGQEIDLVFLNHANPLLLKKILENCQILYGSKKFFYLFKIYAFKRYCDYKKYLDLEKKFVHQFIKEFK